MHNPRVFSYCDNRKKKEDARRRLSSLQDNGKTVVERLGRVIAAVFEVKLQDLQKHAYQVIHPEFLGDRFGLSIRKQREFSSGQLFEMFGKIPPEHLARQKFQNSVIVLQQMAVQV